MTDLPRIDSAALAQLCAQYGIARLELFGSHARGDASDDSDVDLLYELLPGQHLTWEIETLETELTALFGRPVDLVSRHSLHPLIRPGVEAQTKALYAA